MKFKVIEKCEWTKKATLTEEAQLRIAMLSTHSCPIGELGTKDTGGMNVYIRELAQELGNRGHRVDIYTRRHDPNDKQVIELNENVRVIHLKAGKNGYMHKLAIYPYLADFICALEEFRRQEGLQYDLVHSHYWLSGRVGNWAQAYWEIPHIIMFHTLGAVKNTIGVGKKEPRLRIAIERQLVNACHRIVAATERGKRELMRFYNGLPETISVVPCGVNLDHFQPVAAAAARQQLGFDQDERILLYVGRIDPLKGIDRLLASVTYLQQHQRIRLVIIGGDGHHAPELQKLQRMSAELGIQDKVLFVGRIEQEDLPPYYSAADMLVMPSYHESFGLVALESLACGTPVVAAEVGAMGSIIQEGKTGSVVTKASPRSLAKGIEAFLSDSNIKAGSAEIIRASVVKFDWSHVADAMIEEYLTVLKQHDFSVRSRSSAKVALL